MPDKTDVKVDSSTTKDKLPSGEGKNSSTLVDDGRGWENIAKELHRRHEELTTEHSEVKTRIEELEEKNRLSENEKAELARLNKKDTSLDALIEEVENRADAKGWLGAVDKRTEKAKSEARELARHDVLVEMQKDYLEEQADEMKVKYDDLVKKLRPFASRYEEKNPLRKTKLAMRDFLEFEKYQKEKAEFDKTKTERENFSEDGGNKPRETTLEDARTKGDKMAEMKALGL